MKKIKLVLSIVALLATVTVVGMSGSQLAYADEGDCPKCDCEFENPHAWGVDDGGCKKVCCWHKIAAEE